MMLLCARISVFRGIERRYISFRRTLILPLAVLFLSVVGSLGQSVSTTTVVTTKTSTDTPSTHVIVTNNPALQSTISSTSIQQNKITSNTDTSIVVNSKSTRQMENFSKMSTMTKPTADTPTAQLTTVRSTAKASPATVLSSLVPTTSSVSDSTPTGGSVSSSMSSLTSTTLTTPTTRGKLPSTLTPTVTSNNTTPIAEETSTTFSTKSSMATTVESKTSPLSTTMAHTSPVVVTEVTSSVTSSTKLSMTTTTMGTISNDGSAFIIGVSVGVVSFIVILVVCISLCIWYRNKKTRRKKNNLDHINSQSQLANPNLRKKLTGSNVSSATTVSAPNRQTAADPKGLFPPGVAIRNSGFAKHSPFSGRKNMDGKGPDLIKPNEDRTYFAQPPSPDDNVSEFYFFGSNLYGSGIGKGSNRVKDSNHKTQSNSGEQNGRDIRKPVNRTQNTLDNFEELYSNHHVQDRKRHARDVQNNPKKNDLINLFQDPAPRVASKDVQYTPKDVEELYGNKDILNNKRRTREERENANSAKTPNTEIETETSPPFTQIKTRLESVNHMYANQNAINRQREDEDFAYNGYDGSDEGSITDGYTGRGYDNVPDYSRLPLDDSNWSFGTANIHPAYK